MTMPYATIAQALRETLRQQMQGDPRVFILWQEVGQFGGAYRITEGLYEEFGPARVRDTAISEIAIVGIAMGAALTGMRPVAEFQFVDFMTNAMDQICNHMAKFRVMSGGKVVLPGQRRACFGGSHGQGHLEIPFCPGWHRPDAIDVFAQRCQAGRTYERGSLRHGLSRPCKARQHGFQCRRGAMRRPGRTACRGGT
jgi:hypothetical protein